MVDKHMIVEMLGAHIGAIKAFAIMVASALVGAALWLLQGATGSGSATRTIITSLLSGGGVALLIKLIDVMLARQRERKEGRKEKIASADRVLEIENEEKEQIRVEARRLRREAQQISNEKLLFSKAQEFEARARAHRFGGEVMRLQNIIIGLQSTMASHQCSHQCPHEQPQTHLCPVTIPSITLNEYGLLMFGTAEQQAEVAEQIRDYKTQMQQDDPHTTQGT